MSIVDKRTFVADGDVDTGWTGSDNLTLFTSAPNPVEGTSSVGIVVSNATEYMYYTMGAGVNMSAGILVYVWVLAPGGIMDTVANGGGTLLLGDGTNRIGFHLIGSDKAVFRHSTASVSWQCLVLDTGNLPTAVTEYTGTLASLDLTSIVDIGAGFKTLAKAPGGVENCFVDIIRYGNDGVAITGGTVGTPLTFADVAAEDASTAADKAHGVVREFGPGIYGAQCPITIGDNVSTGDTYLDLDGATLIFEDRSLNDGAYGLTLVGNATGTTSISMNKTSIIGAHLPAVDFTSANADIYALDACSFSGMGTVKFSTVDAARHVLTSTFSGCGEIDPGTVNFQNNTIANSTQLTSGAMVLALTNNTDLITFSGNTYDVYITETGTYSNESFSHGTNTTDLHYNNASAATFNTPSDGDTATVTNDSGIMTIVAGLVTLKVIVVDDLTGLALPDARVWIGKDSDKSQLLNAECDVNGEVSVDLTYTVDTAVVGWAREQDLLGVDYVQKNVSGTITSTGLTISVRLTPI